MGPSRVPSHILLLLLGRVAGGRLTCPLSKVSFEDGQNSWTGLPVPAPLAADAVNCSWYQSSSCCSAEDTARILQQEPEIRLFQSSRGCRDVLHMLMCSACSPRQEELFVSERISEFTVPVLRMCESTCDRLYQKCASANYEGKGRVDLIFSSGHQLCTAAGVPARPRRRPEESRACPLRLHRARLVALGGSTVGDAGPLGAQPLPRLLKPATSKELSVHCLWACGHPGVRVVREEDHAVCFSAAAPRRPLVPWCAFALGVAALTVLTLERGQ